MASAKRAAAGRIDNDFTSHVATGRRRFSRRSRRRLRGAFAANAPGVTDTEIKIGQTMPYSGPASAYGVIGKTDAAYFKMVNDHGGVNGRKLNAHQPR